MPVDESDPQRDAVHTLVQEQFGDGAVLTGWVLVTEWMEPDGARSLGRAYSYSLPEWSAKGMLLTMLTDGFHDPGGSD